MPKPTPTDRRVAAINALPDIPARPTLDDALAMADAHAALAPLGRTPRWKAECRHLSEVLAHKQQNQPDSLDWEYLNWALVQFRIYLAWAA